MSRIIVVTSGKGGVGKSTLVANLGSELAKTNKVVLIDADLGLKNLDCILGLENRVIFDIEDVIENRADLMQALVNDKKRENLYILPACRNLDVTKVDLKYMERIVLELQKNFDYILIDCPAGIDDGFHRAVASADEAIVVTTPHISALRDADKVITLLKSYALQNVTVVVNKLRGELLLDGESLYPPEIGKILKTPLIWVLPEA
jgi:septum site-determining protein MinD